MSPFAFPDFRKAEQDIISTERIMNITVILKDGSCMDVLIPFLITAILLYQLHAVVDGIIAIRCKKVEKNGVKIVC